MRCHSVVYAWVTFIYQVFYKYMLLFYILSDTEV